MANSVFTAFTGHCQIIVVNRALMNIIKSFFGCTDFTINGWGTYGLNGWGSYDKVSCCFVWKYAQKIAGLQRSTLSDHRMTTGFSPFELSTCGLLQRGRDYSPPKACFICGAQLMVGFQSIMNIQ